MTARQQARTTTRRVIQRFLYIAIGSVAFARNLRRHRSRSRRADGWLADSTGHSVNRVLLVRLELLGDVLFALPLAESVKLISPDAQVTLLTSTYAAALGALSPAVDEVVAVDVSALHSIRRILDPRTWIAYWRTLRLLRRRRFDLAIAVYGQLGSLWAALAGARRTVGYAREAHPHLLTNPAAGGRHLVRQPEAEYVKSLARQAGIPEPPDHASLCIPADVFRRLERKLKAAGIQPTDAIVVLHAGSVNGSAKRWPARYWSRFAEEIEARAGARIVLVGASSDAVIAQQVIEGAAVPLCSLVGKTDLVELVGILKRADLVATGDSGPLHLAVSLGRPVLAVYGPTDPVIYGPYRPTAPISIHRHDLPCSPCYTLAAIAECPLGDPICMRLVSVEDMVRSALNLLGRGD